MVQAGLEVAGTSGTKILPPRSKGTHHMPAAQASTSFWVGIRASSETKGRETSEVRGSTALTLPWEEVLSAGSAPGMKITPARGPGKGQAEAAFMTMLATYQYLLRSRCT